MVQFMQKSLERNKGKEVYGYRILEGQENTQGLKSLYRPRLDLEAKLEAVKSTLKQSQGALSNDISLKLTYPLMDATRPRMEKISKKETQLIQAQKNSFIHSFLNEGAQLYLGYTSLQQEHQMLFEQTQFLDHISKNLEKWYKDQTLLKKDLYFYKLKNKLVKGESNVIQNKLMVQKRKLESFCSCTIKKALKPNINLASLMTKVFKIESHPTIKTDVAEIEKAESERAIERSNNSPKIAAFLQGDTILSSSNQNQNRAQVSVGLDLTWTITDGGIQSSRLRSHGYKIASLRKGLAYKESQHQLNLTTLEEEINYMKQNLEYKRKMEFIAKENWRFVRDSYKNRNVTIFEYLQSIDSYLNIQKDTFQAEKNLEAAALNYLFLKSEGSIKFLAKYIDGKANAKK